MSAATIYHKGPRLASLFLSFAFAIVGLGLCAHPMLSWNRSNSAHVDAHDVYDTSGLVYVFSAALAIVSLTSLVLSLRTLVATTSGIPSPRMLWVQGICLALVTLGLLGSLITLTFIVATKEAKVTVFAGDVRLPDAVVESQIEALGIRLAYRDFKYLKFSVILLWIAFPFGAISGALSLLAASALMTPKDGLKTSKVAEDGAEVVVGDESV